MSAARIGSPMRRSASGGSRGPANRHRHTSDAAQRRFAAVGTKVRQCETDGEARSFQRYVHRYLTRGLCHRCAAQAAYGHQHGFNSVHAPCAGCRDLVSTLPVAKPNGWRSDPRKRA